jgi:hypothetical protein
MAPSTLAKTGYIASDATLKTLAERYVTGADAADEVRGVYLKVLVAHSLREAQNLTHKRITMPDAIGAVTAANALLYSVILDAVTTPELAADDSLDKDERSRRARERNRRTTFARTAKSTLLSFVKAGGRLVTLDPTTVTKESLRTFVQQARQGPGIPDQIKAARARLEKLVAQLKETDADAAQEAVDATGTALQAVVTPPKPMRGTRRVKDVTLHAAH